MANLVLQLARLQLGAAGGRHRASRHVNDRPPIYINALSIPLQRSSVQRSLLASLHSPAHHVFSLGDRPDVLPLGHVSDSLASKPIFQVAYAQTHTFLAAVDEEGAVGIVNTATKRWQTRWLAHHNAVFDVIWTRDDTQVLTAAGDSNIRVWDAETAARCVQKTPSTSLVTLQGHDMSVKCVRQAPDNTRVFASGGRDGKVLLWDTRTRGTPISTLDNVHAEPSPTSHATATETVAPLSGKKRRVASLLSPRSVTCVEFGATDVEIFTAGAVDAVVKKWDLRQLRQMNTPRKRRRLVPMSQLACSSQEGARRGIASLSLRRTQARTSHLLVNVLNDSIAVLDLGQEASGDRVKPIVRCVGHDATSFYCKAAFDPHGHFIAGASGDGIVYVWDVRLSSLNDHTSSFGLGAARRMPCLALKGHTNEVNGIAWNPQDITQLASCSDDGTLRWWQVGGERPKRSFAATFQLQAASSATSVHGHKQREWTNWSEFISQPNGYAYRVHGPPVSGTYRADTPLKSVVTHDAGNSRLHPVSKGAQTVKDPLLGRGREPRPCRIKLRRNAKCLSPSKRAQRTLVELWRTSKETNCTD